MKTDTHDAVVKESPRRSFLKKALAGIAGGTLLSGMTNVFAGDTTVKPKSVTEIMDSPAMLAELMITPYNFAPVGWALCNGQLLAIAQNTALFSLIGTYFGGDGRTNFALPNLQASVPIGTGQGPGLPLFDTGSYGGSTAVTLLQTEMPSHNHTLQANASDGTSNSPAGLVYASNAEHDHVFSPAGELSLGANTLSAAGGNQPHNNMSPYQVFNVCIATTGIFDGAQNPYVGEIKMFCGNPSLLTGWAVCNGALLSISSYEVLYNLLGTTFGGNGITTFALPDLRGRVPIGAGQGPGLTNRILGEMGGEENVTLTTNEIPGHNHIVQVSSQVGTTKSPAGNYIAANLEGVPQFGSGVTEAMSASGTYNTGGSQPHPNMPPYLAINYIISLFGVYPSQG